VVSLRTTRFNIHKFYVALALRCVFFVCLRTDSDFFFIHYWLVFITVVESSSSSSSSRVGAVPPGPWSPDAPRPYERAFCAPPLVSLFISRGAPRPATWDTSVSEGRKYGREMADPILPTACDFHGKCRDLLHAANLRHGTDGFTSPPKEGMLRILSSEKSDGFSRVWTRELGYQRPAC
jgi:hypothetical protein